MIVGTRARRLLGMGRAAVLVLLLCTACAGSPAAAPTSPATAPSVAPTAAVALPAVSNPAPNATPSAAPTAAAAPQPNAATPSAAPMPTAEAPAPTSTPAAEIALPNVSGNPYPEPPPQATVTPDATGTAMIGEHTLALLVVTTPETRAQGLMFVRELPQDTGMLFVFPEDAQQSFWMRNTFIPLSVAFLDAEGRILNIADMQPLDDQTFHTSAGPARYALEVNQGWFAARQIEAGAAVQLTLPAGLAPR